MRVDSRKQKIIELLSKQTDYLAVKDIARLLNVSIRTIHNDLRGLEEQAYHFDKKPGNGIFLVSRHSDEKRKNEEDFSSPQHRRLLIIEELLFNKKVITIQALSKRYYVSQSSIVSDLQYIKETYTVQGSAKLISDLHGTRFVGSEEEMQKLYMHFNEQQIREFTSVAYINELRTSFYQYYDKKIVDTCVDIIESFKEYTLYLVAQHYMFNIVNVLIVLTYRLKQNCHHTMTHNAFNVNEVMGLNHYLIAKDLLEMIKQRLFISYEDADIYFLSIYLQGNRIKFVATSQSYKKEYEETIRSMIDKMSKNVNVNLNEDEELYQNLSLHITHMKYRLDHGVMIRNPLLHQIKEEFRLMFDLTWLVLEEVKEVLNISLVEDEVGFLMLHFQSSLDKAMKSKRVLVVCPSGYTTSNFIINRIRRVLPPLDILEAASMEDVNRFNLDKIDLIISTIPLNVKDKPVIVVSSLISDYDIENISNIYRTKITSEKQKQHIKNDYIKQLLQPSLIFVNDTQITKEEIIHTVCEKLYEQEIVRQGFEESIINREMKGGSDIATMAAVPHGELSLVKKTQLAIWTNKTPVKWGKYSVKVIIFFCLRKEDLKQAKLILEDIFSLINSKKQVEKKIATLPKEELYALITGGEYVD